MLRPRYRHTPKHIIRAQMDACAEAVANGSQIKAWGASVGLSQTQADRIWVRIRKGLGAQAV